MTQYEIELSYITNNAVKDFITLFWEVAKAEFFFILLNKENLDYRKFLIHFLFIYCFTAQSAEDLQDSWSYSLF